MLRRVLSVQSRLIPARAGKTPARVARCCPSTAHPRACGENLLTHSNESLALGSSPRVRGKLEAGGPVGRGDRLIPARAGKTLVINGDFDGNLGSSPRVRGKLRQ